MAISNELSSEIAAALLAAQGKSSRELSDLKEIVVKVHSVLQQLTIEAKNAQESVRQRREEGRDN